MGIHLSGVVGAIATLPAALAVLGRDSLPPPVVLVLCHTALSGFLVAAAATEALAAHSMGMLGKRLDGSISALHFSMFWPYHLSLRAKLALQRRVSSEPAFSAVTPSLFIGAWPSETALAPAARPLAVLDVTSELPLAAALAAALPQEQPSAYLNLPVWDTHAQIERGVQWAAQQAAAGRAVLVHCAHGHGRSATVLGAILIAQGLAPGAAEAEALMKVQRPRVRLNRRQKAALQEWAALHGAGGKRKK